MFECGIIVFLGMLLSMQLNGWWLPFFSQMFPGIAVSADYLHDYGLLLFMALLLVITTLLAGAYPALYTSRFNPSSIFSGTVKFGGSNLFSRFLLGFQVVVALMTVVAAMAFSENSEFQRTYDFGFRRENLMMLEVPDESSYHAMRGALAQVPGVEATAGTRHHVGFGRPTVTVEVQGEQQETAFMGIGEGYLDLMGIKLAAGRAFDASLAADYENAAMVSRQFASVQGWKEEEALGQKLRMDSVTYSVVGVVEDFHGGNFFDPIQPMFLRFVRPDKFNSIVIRAKPGELISVFDQTNAKWSKLFPLKPFNAAYQDEMGANALQTTESIAKIFSWFAIVSILLSATGLFALVSLTVLKKTKEIAIRRVVGATSGNVLVLVNKGYFWIFIVASAIGSYCGYALTKLLMDMIFKINVGVGVTTILVSVIAILILALTTVGVKVWQALKSNPAAVLKGD
jgi:ABC-type antimicrobial peptide transport system permease subunit